MELAFDISRAVKASLRDIKTVSLMTTQRMHDF
jgi:hypothetical protein